MAIATLEEFLQEKYVDNYDKIEEYESKIYGLTVECPEYFYIPSERGIGSLRYAVGTEGHALYLIDKSGLPKEIQDALVGGDAGEKKYADYQLLNDVYGVTTDLKVYYCSSGINSILGLKKDNLDSDNLEREIFGVGTNESELLQKYDKNKDGIINAQEIRTVESLTLDSNSGITKLEDLFNFVSLKDLILDGLSLDNLNGIQYCSQLQGVDFKNYSNDDIYISDYSAMSNLNNLEYLYLEKSSNKQVNDLCEGIKNANLSKLKRIAIVGYLALVDENYVIGNSHFEDSTYISNVSDISGLEKLSDYTKKAVKQLFLNNNKLNNISFLSGFINVTFLYMPRNNLTTLDGIGSMKSLHTLSVHNNLLGQSELIDNLRESDAIASLKDNTSLYVLDMINNAFLKNISYLKEMNSIKYLYLDGCEAIPDSEMLKLKLLFKNCNRYSYSSKYSILMLDTDIKSLDLKEKTLRKAELESLSSCINMVVLKLDNVHVIDEANGQDISDEEINILFNRVLPNLVNLEFLSMSGVDKLHDISFLGSLRKLVTLDLRAIGVDPEDLVIINGLENLKDLVVSENVDFTYLQPTINRLNFGWDRVEFIGSYTGGLVCTNSSSLKTLEGCTEITSLNFSMGELGSTNLGDTDLNLSRCVALKDVYVSGLLVKSITLPNGCHSVSCDIAYDCGILNFGDNSELVKLQITQMGDNAFRQTLNNLSKCNNLESFYLTREGELPDNFISSLLNCNKLREFTLQGYYWRGSGNYLQCANIGILQQLSSLMSLKVLCFRYWGNTDFNFLSSFTEVEELVITNTDLYDINFISSMASLINVNLENNEITNVDAFSNLSLCENVDLSGNHIEGIHGLSNLRLLKVLDLSDNALYDYSSYNGENYNNLSIIANLNKNNQGSLEEVYLSGNTSIVDFSILKNLNWNNKSGF